MPFQQLANHMPEGAGKLFVIQKTDINGNLMSPPPRFELSLMKIGFENVREIKGQYGKYAMPIDMVTGKETPKLKGEMFNYDIEQINGMFYGGDVVIGSDLTYTQSFVVPDSNVQSHKIRNAIVLSLSKRVSHTSATIAGVVAASAAIGSSPAAGEIGVASGGKYYFHKNDIGKTAAVTWVCLNGATVVSTFKIPDIRDGFSSININLFYSTTSVKKGASTWVKDSFDTTSAAPATGHYQASANGVLVFNSAATGSITISHKTDNITVSSVIDTLPSAAYQAIIDPPGLSAYLSTISVTLVTDSGTAMTGVADGETLTVAVGAPTSGQYENGGSGLHTFAAADVGDLVKIEFVQDFFWKSITPPNDGVFVKHLSVKIKQTGEPLREMREQLGGGSILSRNEYTIDGGGTLYFDSSNRGQTVFYTYLYHTDIIGRSLTVENHEQGSGIELELTITHKDGAILDTISGIRAMAKHHKLDENEGDKAKSDVEFELYANDDGTVYKWSTSTDMV